jgi:hypothetical protein
VSPDVVGAKQVLMVGATREVALLLSLVRALGSHLRGREFESHRGHT